MGVKRYQKGLLLTGLDLLLILLAFFLTHNQQYANAEEAVTLSVLMYHSVTAGEESDYRIQPATFAADLAYLQRNGYTTVSAAQLVAYTNGTGDLPEKPVLLTFDDGFYNNYSEALPLLEQYDMCAVISVVGTFTETLAPAAPHVDAYSYLMWEDLRAVLDSGRIELGSHTYALHNNAERCGCAISEEETESDYHDMLLSDLGLLQSQFQSELQIQPFVFAYPYGFLCPESNSVLQELGFLVTLNCREATNQIVRDPACLYGLNRFNRYGNCDTEIWMQRLE
jgi:peptidoglycan/xylan/chitin deacetylase (PgdA/CDA1 family)